MESDPSSGNRGSPAERETCDAPDVASSSGAAVAGPPAGARGTDDSVIVGGGVLEASTTTGSGASEHAVSKMPSTPPSTVRATFTQTTLVTSSWPRVAGERQLRLKIVKIGCRTADTCVVTDANNRADMDGPRRRRAFATAILSTLTIIAASIGFGGPTRVQAVADSDWLTIVNTYRAMSGLAPVTANPGWSSEAQAHSCYMLQNGISHDEVPGNPGYTVGGDTAGNSGNVAVSSVVSATARNHIDLWMTGPFHAIGILRHNLTSSGFGLCAAGDTPTPWHSGGTLDVIRGIDHSLTRPSTPIVFPGDGATVPLHSFITEFPNPMTLCGWTGSAGLPLIAMMPDDVTSANATITGPNGPVPTCALHAGNTSADATARAILDGDNAVVVMPREVLADGTYTVTVNTNSGNVTWSFTVDRGAPLEVTPESTPDTSPTTKAARFEPVTPFRLVDTRKNLGSTRLRAGEVTRIQVGASDIVAASANFTVVSPTGYGYITAYNCTAERPTVSTLGFQPGQTVANQAIVPLERGELCVFSLVDTDLIIDVNGYYRTVIDGSGFVPVKPARLLDTRDQGVAKLRAGVEVRLKVAGVDGGAPADATGVALNVTVIEPRQDGHLQVYPCGAASRVDISNVNYVPNEYRPNSVVSPVGEKGRICLRSLRDTHVAIDLTGYFSAEEGLDFLALDPVRLFDSRSFSAGLNEATLGQRVRAGQVVRVQIAGERGIPEDARAVAVNLTATDALNDTYLTAYPCGTLPKTSNVNIVTSQFVNANGAMVKLSASGELCIYSKNAVHLIVDINGIWQ
jgi:uncharacterized protein YkwD